MTSQNSHARDSINKISSYILFEQNIDIANFTSGHLNENHLWKPPEQKTHKPWSTVNSLPKSDESLSEIRSSKKIGIKNLTDERESALNKNVIDVSLSELKSPRKKKNIFKTDSDDETKLPNIKNKNSELISVYPITNKEMALNVLNSHFQATSKEEKFNNLTQYETKVLKTEDLAPKNALHGKLIFNFFTINN